MEKSYYLLEEIISFAKREGQLEIIEYIQNNPDVKKHSDFFDLSWKVMTKTHLNHDLKMIKFEKNKQRIREYCKKYRYDCYDLYNKINSTSVAAILDLSKFERILCTQNL